MNNLLKAMGFWIWGLIAIGLSLSMVSVGFKVLSINRAHGTSAARSDNPIYSTAEAVAPAAATGSIPSLVTSSVIAREMNAAQNAIQAARWDEALTLLQAAKSKSPLPAVDEKTIYDWMGAVYLKQKNFPAAQSAYEAALLQANTLRRNW